MSDSKAVESEIEADIPENDGPKGIELTDNRIILLLILFTLMIGAWWMVNLYMGRWI